MLDNDCLVVICDLGLLLIRPSFFRVCQSVVSIQVPPDCFETAEDADVKPDEGDEGKDPRRHRPDPVDVDDDVGSIETTRGWDYFDCVVSLAIVGPYGAEII